MPKQTQPEPTGTVISERHQRLILAAMTAMPYAASSRVPKPWTATRETVTADAIVAFLDGLAEVLTEVGAESDTHRRRLFSLEADHQGVPPPHRHRARPADEQVTP